MNKVEITGVDTSNLKTIPNKEMVVLLEQIKQGDSDAREKMIVGNIKLVLSILKKFNNRKESIDDLFQIGMVGLIKAVDNFDSSHNVRFSTYAVPMVMGEIKRYLRDNSSIRVSRSLKDIAYKSIAIKDEYLQKHNREATIEELATRLEVDPIDVIMAFDAMQDTVSMSTPIYDNGGDIIELTDQISSTENIVENISKEHMLKQALKVLHGREKTIIYDRYFNDKTQMEIASELGISQAQVSRIEKSALKVMYNVIK